MAGTNKKNTLIKSTPCIILKDPQLPENIGMCARAMFNYGFSDLRLVNPVESWSNKKAIASSAGAFENIQKSIRVFSSFEQAVKGVNILFATSVRVRDLEKTVLTPREAINIIKNKYSNNNIGFLFGPEKAGLNNNDVSEANFIIQIPTNPAFGSLNLAMAVNIICYEWFINYNKDITQELENILDITDKKNLLNFKDFLIKNLHETSFFDDKSPQKLEINVKNIFSKSMLSDKDLLILYGVIKSLKNYKISN